MPSNISEIVENYFTKVRGEMAPEWIAKAVEQGRQNRLAILEDRRRSCLSKWYPAVSRIDGIKTPITEILTTTLDLERLIFEDKKPQHWDLFISTLERMAAKTGYPAFLRTGLTSDKHSWLDTCYLANKKRIEAHVFRLIEFSVNFDLPTDTWVMREMLDIKAMFFAFNGMPVTTERRYFIRDGKVICHHPYWPAEALDSDYARPDEIEWKHMLEVDNAIHDHPTEAGYLKFQSERVSDRVPGFWSVDWLLASGGSKGAGWYLTDMGDGHQSYHWPGCPNDPNTQQQEGCENGTE